MIDFLNPNTITGVIAIFMSALAAYAYWPYVVNAMGAPVGRMAAGVFAFVSIMAARLTWWDVVWKFLSPDTVQYLRTTEWLGYSPWLWINAGFNALWIMACYIVLSSIYMSIPARDRSHWHVLTAPFYPDKLKLFRRLFRKGEK